MNPNLEPGIILSVYQVYGLVIGEVSNSGDFGRSGELRLIEEPQLCISTIYNSFSVATNKVIATIFGGIGNQLFCYAAARRLAVVSGAELVIDDVSGFARDRVYMRRYQLDHFNISCRKTTRAERLEPFSHARHYLRSGYNRHRPFDKRTYIVQDRSIDFEPRLLVLRPRGTLRLQGYWQSESYFQDIEAVIREDLRIVPPADKANLEMAARVRDSLAVAVHVRFFDTPDENGKGNNNITGEYYTRAVARMETLAPGAHYFVFSDRPDAARALIPLPDSRATCISHNQSDEMAYADLWLMTQCRHFIIANSTFSWWGAWLAGNGGKQVIAPGFEVRGDKTSWGFSGLLPEAWIKV